jgi:hypothetical protein
VTVSEPVRYRPRDFPAEAAGATSSSAERRCARVRLAEVSGWTASDAERKCALAALASREGETASAAAAVRWAAVRVAVAVSAGVTSREALAPRSPVVKASRWTSTSSEAARWCPCVAVADLEGVTESEAVADLEAAVRSAVAERAAEAVSAALR